jgi:hypothetical protein
MTIPKPTVEDQRKLHAEVTQIMQQRFALTTTAVAAFGVMLAWALPRVDSASPAKDSPLKDLPLMVYGVSIALVLVLAVIYFLHSRLRHYARLLTVYLAKSDSSVWEKQWREFRNPKFNRKYVGYTVPQTWVFRVLGFLATLYPLLVAVATRLAFSLAALAISSSFGISFLIWSFVVPAGERKRDLERGYEEDWDDTFKELYGLTEKEILAAPTSSVDAPKA